MSSLEKIYKDKVAPELSKEFNYTSVMQIPSIKCVSLNMGLGEGSQNNKIIQDSVRDLSLIAGQRAVVTRAKKSIAAFKLREGMPVGCRVSLRGDRMWAFLEKLLTIALPRVRDFRGVPDRGFDGRGNYTLGIKEHTIFPEIEIDRIEKAVGMNISVITTAQTDKEGKMLLKLLGMPFKK
ncbi:MAG: 50S ribosomal protein L5 [Deltaproteobacteria bacterium HGW-Deltaproteobacteria-18]|jgi:large subunit ribosomal protein L5|nr:MAG: 50S ribosomal protein L5 [Deltaproteobacteria bacterium HGW-Deltaproteobacteria-18]